MDPIHASRFAPLEGPVADRWARFPSGWDRVLFPTLVGLELEEVRTEQRGRTLVFCRAEVRTAGGKLAADGTLPYTIRPPR
jgi:hypothetical protein